MSKHLVPAGDIVLEGCRTFRRQSLSGKKSLRVGLEALQPGITSCLLSVPLGKCLCVFMCVFLCVTLGANQYAVVWRSEDKLGSWLSTWFESGSLDVHH